MTVVDHGGSRIRRGLYSIPGHPRGGASGIRASATARWPVPEVSLASPAYDVRRAAQSHTTARSCRTLAPSAALDLAGSRLVPARASVASLVQAPGQMRTPSRRSEGEGHADKSVSHRSAGLHPRATATGTRSRSCRRPSWIEADPVSVERTEGPGVMHRRPPLTVRRLPVERLRGSGPRPDRGGLPRRRRHPGLRRPAPMSWPRPSSSRLGCRTIRRSHARHPRRRLAGRARRERCATCGHRRSSPARQWRSRPCRALGRRTS